MVARLGKNPSQAGDVTLKSDTDAPIYLRYDYTRFPQGVVRLPVRYSPQGPTDVQEWAWMPGKAGAGNSRETPASYADGGWSYGLFHWGRRLGVAQAAGKLIEVHLPKVVTDFLLGTILQGQEWGASQDFFFTTLGPSIIRVVGGDGVAEEAHNTGAGGITTGIATWSFGGNDYLAVGDSINGIRLWDGTAWTAGTAGDIGGAGTACGWLATPHWTIGPSLATGAAAGTAGSPAHRLVGVTAIGSAFAHCADDPRVAGNWSALTQIGLGGGVFPVLGYAESNHHVWFAKPNGICDADAEGNTPNLTQWQAQATAPLNNRAIAYWNGMIWSGTEHGLMAFAPDGSRVDLPTFVQFGALGSNNTPIWGRPRALGVSPEGLYVGYYNSITGDSYIGMLCLTAAGEYHWSMAEAVIYGEEVTCLRQASPGGIPRLWIATVDPTNSPHLYWQHLPRSGDPETDIATGGTFEAASDWSAILSRTSMGRPIPKTFREYTGEFDGLGADFPDNTVTISASADGGPFSVQGTATTQDWSSTPREGYVRAKSVQFRLDVHNDPTAPVTIRSLIARYSPRPKVVRYVTFPVIFSDEDTGLDPYTTMQRLQQAPRSGPYRIEDQYGRVIEGDVEPTFNEYFTLEADGKSWVGHADVTISTTRMLPLFDEAIFDSGDEFS